MLLSKNGTINIISISLAIIGILLSIYFYNKSNLKRIPIIFFETPTELLNSAKLSTAPIKIFKRDGSEIKSNLYLIKFYFWNNGNLAIKQENILKPICLSFQDSSVELFEVNIQSVSRDVITPSRNIDTSNYKHCKITLNFKILEQGDGFSGQIMYSAQNPITPTLEGIIEGVKKIHFYDPTYKKLLIKEREKVLLVSDICLILFFIIIVFLIASEIKLINKIFQKHFIKICLLTMLCILIFIIGFIFFKFKMGIPQIPISIISSFEIPK